MGAADFDREMVLDQPELDRQHALLFARLQTIAGLLDGPAKEVEQAVSRFADELLSHLAEEEEQMAAAAYPDAARHKAAHELFVADLLQMREELREKGPTPLVGEWIKIRLPEWLRFHIRVNDAAFVAFLARRAAQPTAPARKKNGRQLPS